MLLRPGYVTKEQMEAVLGEEGPRQPAILEKAQGWAKSRALPA